MEETDLDSGVLLDTALTIDDIDQVHLSPNDEISIVWADISERPDLAVLRDHSAQAAGDVVCTWFLKNPGKWNMIVGVRVALSRPTPTMFVLSFLMERLAGHLAMIARYGKLWIVPGPPHMHRVGMQEMETQTFLTQVVNFSGHGVLIQLEAHLVAELRTWLNDWKRLKEFEQSEMPGAESAS